MRSLRILAGALLCGAILGGLSDLRADFPFPYEMDEAVATVQGLDQNMEALEQLVHQHFSYPSSIERDIVRVLETYHDDIKKLEKNMRRQLNHPEASEADFRTLNRRFYRLEDQFKKIRKYSELKAEFANVEVYLIALREMYPGNLNGAEVLDFADRFRVQMENVVRQASREANHDADKRRVLSQLSEIKDFSEDIRSFLKEHADDRDKAREQMGRLKKLVVRARDDVREADFSDELVYLWGRANGLRLQMTLEYFTPDQTAWNDVRGLRSSVDEASQATDHLINSLKRANFQGNPKAKRALTEYSELAGRLDQLAKRLDHYGQTVGQTYRSFTRVQDAYVDANSSLRSAHLSTSVSSRNLNELAEQMRKLASYYRD